MKIRVSMNITPERAAMALLRALYSPGVSQSTMITAIHRTSIRKLVSTVKSVTEEGGRTALDSIPEGFTDSEYPKVIEHAIVHAMALISKPSEAAPDVSA